MLHCSCVAYVRIYVAQVKNLTTVEHLLQQPFHIFTHPTYGTVMRMLDEKESFTINILMQ